MDQISAQDIVDTMRDGVLLLSTDLRIVSANRSFYHMFQTDPDQTVGRKLYELGNGQWDIGSLRTLLEEVVPLQNTVESYEVDHVFPDIGRKIMLLNARKVYRAGNHVAFFVLAIDDVTSARLSQIEAERHWRLAENIVDTMRDPLLILEADMTVVTASRAFLRLFGTSQEEIFGKRLDELGQGEWKVSALAKRLASVVPHDDQVNDFLLEDEFAGLGRRIFKVNARKVFRPGNHVTRLLVVFEDATQSVLGDRHRDILAAELAHRIKNSLQLISAFVAFEVRRAAEPCIDGYQAMQTRIAAVAELYDVIAKSSAFGPVDMPTYLDGIRSSVASSLLGQSDDITILADAEPLSILPDYAVPVGLIANELATNAVKHAFPTGKGKINLGFQRRDGEVTLTVTDNGAGMGTKTKGSKLGSQFIDAFVKQLKGTMAAATGAGGTTFTVRLPASILAESDSRTA